MMLISSNPQKNQDIVEKLDKDITKFINDNKCDLTIMVNLSSTEKTVNLNNVHNNIKEFEKGLLEDSLDITTSMIYAYAAFKMVAITLILHRQSLPRYQL